MFKITLLCLNTLLLLYIAFQSGTNNGTTMDPKAQQIHAIDIAFPSLTMSESTEKRKAELIKQILDR
jgi:hypothetical protein